MADEEVSSAGAPESSGAADGLRRRAPPSEGGRGGAGSDDESFTCNICFDLPEDPVVTRCGHLFCWTCLFQWLERAAVQSCPVCKAGVTKDNVTPIYGRGRQRKDPRERQEVPQEDTSVPERPRGERPRPQRNPRAGNHAHGANFSFHAGFGFFPGIFPGFQFSFGNGHQHGVHGAPAAAQGRQVISEELAAQAQATSMKLVAVLAFVVLLLLFA